MFEFSKKSRLYLALLMLGAVMCGGCLKREVASSYYGKVNARRIQELRWSDGGLPRTFDPAQAAAAPETDAVRALYEGLTEYDAQTLKPVPGVAVRWKANEDARQWTFYLRPDARWSNGESVTAGDFVWSWRRAAYMGKFAPHRRLMENIEGVRLLINTNTEAVNTEKVNPGTEKDVTPDDASLSNAGGSLGGNNASGAMETALSAPPVDEQNFGVEAIDSRTLRVRLKRPDADFPTLVAHTVFRPVYTREGDQVLPRTDDASGQNENAALTSPRFPTNGAFRLSSQSPDKVILERAENYWDAQTVKLDRVQFVDTKGTEETLNRYRAGEIDLVTNVALEPLVVKLLASYRDFQRETFGALNFYRFNASRPPFDDARVRRALALAVNRDRLNRDTLGDTMVAAEQFIPTDEKTHTDDANSQPHLAHDVNQARQLLADAGYEGGLNFPTVRLLVNRNDEQRAVALAIAEMWRTALGIETQIIVKDWNDYEAALRLRDYDIARRSHVMQTPNETNNVRLMFETENLNGLSDGVSPNLQVNEQPSSSTNDLQNLPGEARGFSEIINEQKALEILPAMPLYFAASFSLTKPYVANFDRNILDATSLKHIKIDTTWQPPDEASKITIKYNE